MKPFYLNNLLPELYFNSDYKTPFQLPFNIPGVLILAESYKPIWITTKLLQIVQKEGYIEKSSIPKIDFVIENKIIPNFTSQDFKSWINKTVKSKKEVLGEFSKPDIEIGIHDHLRDIYQPIFLPLFKKNGVVSHVLFYLNPFDSSTELIKKGPDHLFEELEKIKRVNEKLFENHSLPILAVDQYLKITSHNKRSEALFPKLSNSRKRNFLDLWSTRNQPKLAEFIYKTQSTIEEELIVFEELDDRIKKLRIKFQNIAPRPLESSSVLVSIENLNLANDKENELTRKGFLLQNTHFFSSELENDEENFIKSCSSSLIKNFELNGMYWIDFNQETKEKYMISFPKKKKEIISFAIYQAHLTAFSQIFKRNIKQITSNKIFGTEIEYNYFLRNSSYLLGVPIHTGEKQTGVVVYLSDNKKTDLDSLFQLYSLTSIFYKILSYQMKLNEIEQKV